MWTTFAAVALDRPGCLAQLCLFRSSHRDRLAGRYHVADHTIAASHLAKPSAVDGCVVLHLVAPTSAFSEAGPDIRHLRAGAAGK